MRIGGEARGGGPNLETVSTPWLASGDRHLGSSSDTDDVLFVMLQSYPSSPLTRSQYDASRYLPNGYQAP